MSNQTSDWRDGMLRYTAEFANTFAILAIGRMGTQLADSAVSYMYKSNYSFKPVSSKLTTAERMGKNVEKAIGEAADPGEFLGKREASFILSTQWTPWGYIYNGPRIVSWAPGKTYSSRLPVKLRYEIMKYKITLEGKKDKDKDKGPPIDYEKFSSAVRGEKVENEPKKDKEKKEPIEVIVLENASMVLGDGEWSLGWGTKVDLTGEIYVGRDDQDPGSIFYEFKIGWSETTLTAAFNDTISIKCYIGRDVEASGNFDKACTTADAVKNQLRAAAKVSLDDVEERKERKDEVDDDEESLLVVDDEELERRKLKENQRRYDALRRQVEYENMKGSSSTTYNPTEKSPLIPPDPNYL